MSVCQPVGHCHILPVTPDSVPQPLWLWRPQQSHLGPTAFSPGPCSLFYQEAGISASSWTCVSAESEHTSSSLLIERPKPLGLEGQFSHPPPHKPGCLCFLSLGRGHDTVPIQQTRQAHSPNPVFAHLSTFNPEESQEAGLIGVTYPAKFGWVCSASAPSASPGHYALAPCMRLPHL